MATSFKTLVKPSLLVLCAIVIQSSYNPAFSQDETFDTPASKKKTDQEVYKEKPVKEYKYNKVMIIPYRPNMHVSDADPELCRATQKTSSEIRTQFRAEFDYSVTARIMPIYKTRPIMRAQTEEDMETLGNIYRSVRYAYEPTKKPNYEEIFKEKVTLKDRLQQKLKLKFEKKDQASTQADDIEQAYLTSGQDDKYMRAEIKNDSLLHKLEKEYGTDLFVFINQLEIKTLSKSCYDLQIKNYVREVKVHFSIYDSDGREISGDVISVIAETSSNDVSAIVQKAYPKLTEEIAAYLPTPRKTVNDLFRERAKERQKDAEKKAKLAKKNREKTIYETGQLK